MPWQGMQLPRRGAIDFRHWAYGYEVTNLDVMVAYDDIMEATRNAGCESKTKERIRKLLDDD